MQILLPVSAGQDSALTLEEFLSPNLRLLRFHCDTKVSKQTVQATLSYFPLEYSYLKK